MKHFTKHDLPIIGDIISYRQHIEIVQKFMLSCVRVMARCYLLSPTLDSLKRVTTLLFMDNTLMDCFGYFFEGFTGMPLIGPLA